jgi:hypothetical protein
MTGLPPGHWSSGHEAARLATAFMLMIAMLGGGVLATVYAAHKVIPWVQSVADHGSPQLISGTGPSAGRPVLVRQKTGSAGPLTIRVTGIKVTADVTRVTMRLHNDGSDSLHLALQSYGQLSTRDGTTLPGDGLDSQGIWPDNVPPGQTVKGTAIYSGTLPAGTTSVTVSFSQIFGTLGGPDTIAVHNIPVRLRTNR